MKIESIHILEWKTFIIFAREITGRLDKTKTGNSVKTIRCF